jgi:NAD-dependent SIR2 family protein deacetylase
MSPTLAADILRAFLGEHARVFVLTGAGISTNSGIPDYRDAAGQWKRTPPITWQAFVGDPRARARYWARSFVGWPVVARARPNGAHAALARLQQEGRLAALVTQNVDGLHSRAGHEDVIDLHGRIDQVICLGCGATTPREQVQARLAEQNPDWTALEAPTAPDGDADLDALDFSRFRSPTCARCDGLLKPDVVFFGENVPRARVQSAQAALAHAGAMLVVGSSLMVYSGYRFARMARELALPLALLTHGVTRADDIATLKLPAECEATLAGVA